MRNSFQAKITLQEVYCAVGDNISWECLITFIDFDSGYQGYDIEIGDVVTLDTSFADIGTMTFYSITSIVTPDYATPRFVMEYMTINENPAGPPDLGWFIGAEGVIARPSTNLGLLPVVSRDAQLINDKFTEYVQNYNFTKIVDNLQAGDRTFSKINDTAGPMLKGMVVYITELDDTRCKTGVATSYETAHVAGLIADAVVPTGVAGEISSKGMLEKTASEWDIITGDVGGLKGGKDYFLRTDFAGGLTSVPPDGSGQFVVKVGKAISSTVIDISIEPPIQL